MNTFDHFGKCVAGCL